MRVPIPEAFRVKHILLFAIAIFLAQLATGTSVYFALLVFAFLLLFSFSYNIAGGITYSSGGYIFFNGTLTLILGIICKIILFEPAERNLESPLLTMGVYCAGMFSMGVAAYFSRRLRTKRALLQDISVGRGMRDAALGCLVLGVSLGVLVQIIGHAPGTLGSALVQLNRFTLMAILLGTTYEIRTSGGERSTNWIVWTAGLYTFFIGLVSFSKEGTFLGPFCWLIPAIFLRYNFKVKQLVLVGLGIFVMSYYLVPFSQYGRNFRDETSTFSSDLNTATDLLSHPERTREAYFAQASVNEYNTGPHFYDKPEGLFDRLQMVAIDDSLINLTDHGEVYGLSPTIESFLNTLPRLIYRNKETKGFGNIYAHELGIVGEDDSTTGISFSPSAEAFHEATWFGVLVVQPLVLFLVFFVCDSVCGDVRLSPWGLLLTSLFAHVAPEGGLGGPIYVMVYGMESIIAVALLAKYVLPIVGGILTGGKKSEVEKTQDFSLGAGAAAQRR